MSRLSHVHLMSSYNSWMNKKVYEAAASLPAGELARDRAAFFGSILGTLNHLVVADTIWLKRYAAHPANFAALEPVRKLELPARLDEPLFTSLQPMATHRAWLDGVIAAWAEELKETDLDLVIHYERMNGEALDKPLFGLLMHFFNHQTHHRGQVSTLLSQAGVDVGVTDLLALIPNVGL